MRHQWMKQSVLIWALLGIFGCANTEDTTTGVCVGAQCSPSVQSLSNLETDDDENETLGSSDQAEGQKEIESGGEASEEGGEATKRGEANEEGGEAAKRGEAAKQVEKL